MAGFFVGVGGGWEDAGWERLCRLRQYAISNIRGEVNLDQKVASDRIRASKVLISLARIAYPKCIIVLMEI